MRNPKERLQDILDAINAIGRYAALSRAEFEGNELVQVWFLRHLQIIGEAARALPQETRDYAPDIPWSNIIGMRNILVHHYFEIDLDILWDAVKVDIPNLEPKIESLLARLERDCDNE